MPAVNEPLELSTGGCQRLFQDPARRNPIVLLLSRAMRLLPLTWALFVGRLTAWIWYYIIPIRRGVAMQNLERVYGAELTRPEKRRIVRRCMELQAMAVVDLLRATHYLEDHHEGYVEVVGQEVLDEGLRRGKGIVGITLHCGNVDVIGYELCARGYPVHAVVKEIHWGPAQSFMRAVRSGTGLALIAPRRSKERIRELLLENQVVALVVDQHMAPHRAIVCEFFGQLAATSPAPAKFIYETGAHVVLGVVRRVGNRGRYRLHLRGYDMESPYDDLDANIRHNTERFNRIFERWIREDPSQWLWLHKRFKVQDEPDGWDVPDSLRHLLTTGSDQSLRQ